MKKFLCYDTNDAASGKIGVNSNGVLSPNATVPSTNGAPYQQLVTDGTGTAKWEDKLAYDKGRKNLLVINFAWIDNAYRIETEDMAMQFHDICDNYSEVMVAIGGQDLLMTTNWASGEYSLNYNNKQIIRNYIGGAHPYLIHLDLDNTPSIGIVGNSLGDEATVALYIDGGVKQIDPKYIKDMYYEGENVLSQIDQATIDGVLAMTPYTYTVGKPYTVIVNGVTYETTCHVLTSGSSDYCLVGLGVYPPTDDIPFCLSYGVTDYASNINDGYELSNVQLQVWPPEFSGEIKVVEKTIKQIDPKYIPDTTVKVNITENEDGTPRADKTYDEVKTLIDSGVDVKCVLNNGMVFDYIVDAGGGSFCFEFNSVALNMVVIIIFTRNGLVTKQGPFDEFVLPEVSTSDNNKFLSVVNGAWQASSDLIIPSSTSGSSKKFKIIVDDSGAITATEV